MEKLLDQYIECLENNTVTDDLLIDIDTCFKSSSFYTLVEQDDDGSFFVATYFTEDTNLEALYIYTSEEEVPYGLDYMDAQYEDLKDLLIGSSVSIVIVNNESHNLYFEVNNLISKDTVLPLKLAK